MNHTFTFEDLYIWNEPNQETDTDEEPHTINVEVDLICTFRGKLETGRFGPSEYYDPGSPPEWEIEEIRLMNPSMQPVSLTETQFITLFPNGQDIINNALEDAACNGEVE